MEPVSAAIIAAIGTGVVSAAPGVVEKAVSDAYDYLKGLLERKVGSHSDLVHAVAEVEKHPESAGRKATLSEESTLAGVGNDAELLAAAHALLAALKESQQGGSNRQIAMGNNIAQASNNSSASVNVNCPTPPKS